MINEIGQRERREEQEENCVYVEHTKAQIFFFLLSARKNLHRKTTWHVILPHILSKGSPCGRSMNEDGQIMWEGRRKSGGGAQSPWKSAGYSRKLTCIIRPTTNTIATQLTISAWFWMTNSWLRIGGFFLSFLLPKGLLARNADMALHFHNFLTFHTQRELTR